MKLRCGSITPSLCFIILILSLTLSTLPSFAANNLSEDELSTNEASVAAPAPQVVVKHKHFSRSKSDYKGEVSYRRKSLYKGNTYKNNAFAQRSEPNHFEVIGGLGIANLRASNSSLGTLGVTSSETDTLVQTNRNAWDAYVLQLGVGYNHDFCDFKGCSNDVQWFPTVAPQLNFYYLTSDSISGDVWRFNNAGFNQSSFDIPVHSYRLMLDGVLTMATWRQLSLYIKGGIGNAWNQIEYNDSDKETGSTCPNQGLKLNTYTNSNFAWEAGLGLSYPFAEKVSISFEYLYANLGRVRTAYTGNTGTITTPVVSPARFNLKTQTALLGLHISL